MISKDFDYSSLSEDEQTAYRDIYPLGGGDRARWDVVKYDYLERKENYDSVMSKIEEVVPRRDGSKMVFLEPVINSDFIRNNFPRLLPNIIQVEGGMEHRLMLSFIKSYMPNAEEISLNSLKDLNVFLLRYADDDDELVNIQALMCDLRQAKLLFIIDSTVQVEVKDFEVMNALLSEVQGNEYFHAPYNRAEAFFIVFYYMRQNTIALIIIKNMELLIGNYNGLIRGEDLLKTKEVFSFNVLTITTSISLFSFKFTDFMDEIRFRNVAKLFDGFPTLVDMKASSYVLKVLENDDDFIVSRPRMFAMNKITYYDFAELYIGDNIENRYLAFYQTMIFVFRLLIPDEENFNLAKSIGLIESEKINWEYWKKKVIKKSKFSRNIIATRKHAMTLLKVKNDYYAFIRNLIADYRRKRVNDPVGLVFNIAAIIFAVAGVIQVLQAANIIPPRAV